MNVLDCLSSVGIRPRHTNFGEQRLPCPSCKRGPKDTALALLIDEVGATWCCFRCGLTGGAKEQGVRQEHRPAPPSPPKPDAAQYAARIWSESLPIERDSTAGSYLRARK